MSEVESSIRVRVFRGKKNNTILAAASAGRYFPHSHVPTSS